MLTLSFMYACNYCMLLWLTDKIKKVISPTKRTGSVFPLLHPGHGWLSVTRIHTCEHWLILLFCFFYYLWLCIDKTPDCELSVPFYSVYTHTHSLRPKGSTCPKQDGISIYTDSNCWFVLGAWCFVLKFLVDAISQTRLPNSLLKSYR